MKKPIKNLAYNFACPFLLSLSVYLWTLAPTVIWGDSAGLALKVYKLSLKIGTASDHPLYLLLGRVFARLPGELAWNLNLLSAVFGALTVALVYASTFKLTRSQLAGWVAALALCFSHTFWLHAVITEVYTLNAFFVALLVYLLLKWREQSKAVHWLCLAALTFLLGLTNHLILAALLPALVCFILLTEPSWISNRTGAMFLASGLGIALILFLIFPTSFLAVIKKLWFGPPGISHYFTLPDGQVLAKEALFYVLYLMYQFPLVGFVLGFWGIRSLLAADWRAALFLLLAMGVNGLFFIKTTAWPSLGSTKYTFYISDYVVFSIFIGYGAYNLFKGRERWEGGRIGSFVGAKLVLLSVIAAPLLTYNLVPPALKALGIDLLRARKIPFRDNYTFFLNPSKRGERGARRFGEAAFQVVKPNSVLIADYTPHSVLLYLQKVEGVRPDVILVSSYYYDELKDLNRILAEYASEHPIYLADTTPGYYKMGDLEKNFRLVPAGPVFEVVKK